MSEQHDSDPNRDTTPRPNAASPGEQLDRLVSKAMRMRADISQKMKDVAANASPRVQNKGTIGNPLVGDVVEKLRGRAAQVAASIKSKGTEAVAAGKVEVQLFQEKSSISSLHAHLNKIAIKCGATAASSQVTFEDGDLRRLQQAAATARQAAKATQAEYEALTQQLSHLDPKADPALITEIKNRIKDLGVLLKQQMQIVEAKRQELGLAILSLNVPDPRFAQFYQEQRDINQKLSEHAMNVSGLEQEKASFKKSLGFDVRKLLYLAVLPVLLIVIGICAAVFEELNRKTTPEFIKQMQGQWHQVANESGGKRASIGDISNQLIVQGQSVQMQISLPAGPSITLNRSFSLDASHDPAWIDESSPEGIYHGLISIDGNTMRIYMAKPGTSRPHNYRDAEGDGDNVNVYERNQ